MASTIVDRAGSDTLGPEQKNKIWALENISVFFIF